MGPFDLIVGYDAAGILSRIFASDFRVQQTRGYKINYNSCCFAKVTILHVTERQTNGGTEMPWL